MKLITWKQIWYSYFCRKITELILSETKVAKRQLHVFVLFTAKMQLRTELINNGKTTLLFKMTVKKCYCWKLHAICHAVSKRNPTIMQHFQHKFLLQNSSLDFRIFCIKIVFILLRNLMSTFRTKMRLNQQLEYVCMCKRFICFLVLILIIQG